MTTKRSIVVIIIAAIVALVLQVLLGTFLSAKLSTWPLLSRFKFLNPQTPIVINNREITRISDSGDLADIVNKTKSKISAVVAIQNNTTTVVGTAINLTSDGIFLTSFSQFTASVTYAVVLNDGKVAAISQTVMDPATKLVFLKTSASDVSIASFGNSKDAVPGEKVTLVNGTLTPFEARFSVGYIGAGQNDASDKVIDANQPSRSFTLNPGNGSVSGSVVANVSAEIIGVWTGDKVVSSDVIKPLLALYFADKTAVSRPEFGFSYQFLSRPQAALLTSSSGARVVKVDKPASGLSAGDVIIKANNVEIDRASALEEVAEQIKPGQGLVLEIMRGTNQVTVTVIAGELKN